MACTRTTDWTDVFLTSKETKETNVRVLVYFDVQKEVLAFDADNGLNGLDGCVFNI